MNKQSPFRVILNLVLIVIVVISVVATGFVSIKGYRSNRIPEIHSDKQITKVVKEEYPDFEFSKEDEWNIETQLADDSKSFVADIDIIRSKELCSTHYGVQLTFDLVKGSWKPENLPGEIVLTKNEWFFENTNWSVTAEDGTIYELAFLPDLEANLSILESETAFSAAPSAENTSVNVLESEDMDEDAMVDDATDEVIDDDNPYYEADDDEEDLDNRNIEETTADADGQNNIVTCVLSEFEDGTYFQGTFDLTKGRSIMLTVTEDSVTIQLSGEGGELILEKR